MLHSSSPLPLLPHHHQHCHQQKLCQQHHHHYHHHEPYIIITMTLATALTAMFHPNPSAQISKSLQHLFRIPTFPLHGASQSGSYFAMWQRRAILKPAIKILDKNLSNYKHRSYFLLSSFKCPDLCQSLISYTVRGCGVLLLSTK